MTDGPTDGGYRIRAAEADDAMAIAPLILSAGGGVYEFQLDGLFGDAPLVEVLASGICGVVGNFSYRQMLTAIDGDDQVVGLAHGYPTVWMRELDRSFIPADRLAHLSAFDALQDWGSYFVSALAVTPARQNRGMGGALLDGLTAKARAGGFRRLSLHVWADNDGARRFYRRHGFTEAEGAAIPWHPRLPHHGGSVLLLRDI